MHKEKHINDFGKDKISSLVLRVSIPFMIAQFVNVFYSIADRIYIGNLPDIGKTALAGAGVCAPIVTLLSSFGTLIGIGGSILFSLRLGQKNKEQAKQILGSCFTLLVGFSAVLTILAAGLIVPALPYLLSFAAGAMLHVVVEELIPEMSAGEYSNIGTVFFAVGFSLMMILDVALG